MLSGPLPPDHTIVLWASYRWPVEALTNRICELAGRFTNVAVIFAEDTLITVIEGVVLVVFGGRSGTLNVALHVLLAPFVAKTLRVT